MTIFASGRAGITRRKTAGGGGGVITTPVILGSASTHADSTDPHTSSMMTGHTVTAGTEVLLLIIMYGPNTSGGSEATPSSSVDGSFTLITAADFSGSASLAKPRCAVWQLTNPTAGAHNITYGVATADLAYSAAAAINLDGTQAADRFGAVENFRIITAPSNTFSDSLTTERENSLVVAWGAWQGGGADPITEDLGLTALVEFQTGGGGTTDAVLCVATKTGPTPAGAVSYGFTASISEDYAYGALEIRGA